MASGCDADGEKKIVHLLMRGRCLGSGIEGTVCFGILKYSSSAIPVAVKSPASEAYRISLRRESEFLKHLGDSQQIIRFFGESESTYELFLEFAPEGSLRDVLKRSGPLDEWDARRFTRSILQGLRHVHRRDVVHCDIKPANLLVVKNEEREKVLKIGDFGSAMWSHEENVDHRYRGTAYYLAPECVKKNEYGAPSDVWALGCTVAEMVTGKPARSYLKEWATNVDDVLDLIASGGAMPEIPEDMSETGKDFLGRCFEIDPRKRWTVDMLLAHPFAVGDEYMGTAIGKQFAWTEKVTEIVTRLGAADAPPSDHLQEPAPQFDMWNENVFNVYGQERVLEITRRSSFTHAVSVGHERPAFDMWNEKVFDFYGPKKVLDIISAANVLPRPCNDVFDM